MGVVDCDANRDFCSGSGLQGDEKVGGPAAGPQHIRAYPVIRAFMYAVDAGAGGTGGAVRRTRDFDEHTSVHYSLIPARIVKFVKRLFEREVRLKATGKWEQALFEQKSKELEELESQRRRKTERERKRLEDEKEYARQLPHRKMLKALYRKHNPAKLDDDGTILNEILGKLENLCCMPD